MSKTIQFVSKFNDHSTEHGFQFEFRCDNCNKGFRTRFKRWGYGTVSTLADSLGDFFGGVLDKVTDLDDKFKDSAWESAHDKAYKKAIEETKADFMQCPVCSSWICKQGCWDPDEKMCISCVESAVGEEDEEAPVEEIESGVVVCGSCGAEIDEGAKFCAECGAKLETEFFCTSCGVKLDPGDKFCSDCGVKMSDT